MMLVLILVVLFLMTLLPVVITHANLRRFCPATEEARWLDDARRQAISILIPARNEASSIGTTLESLFRNDFPVMEVLVLDDESEDDTAAKVREAMTAHSNLRLLESVPLPEGWNGKQHACWRLAQAARHDWLLFLDADVRLAPDAIVRLLAEARRSEADLLSGFPYQETGSVAEKLLIPLMYTLLLGYLPLARMRRSHDPSLAAGCGQLMLARRDPYFKCDGHRSIRESRHDGLKLPRSFRRQRMKTDLFDAADLAVCRMYRDRREVVRGLLKNAVEGVADPRLIGPFTFLLGGAAIAPVVVWIGAWWLATPVWFQIGCGLATLLSLWPRLLIARRYRHSPFVVFCQPIAIAWFLGLQWLAWWQARHGVKVAWRGRLQT